MGLFIVGLILLKILMVIGWSACSFWLGYSSGKCWLIVLPIMVALVFIYIGGFTSFFSYGASASASDLDIIISNISTMVIFGVVLFGAGIFFRYGIHKDGTIQMLSFINAAVMGFIAIYFALAFTSERSGYAGEKTFFGRQCTMMCNPIIQYLFVVRNCD